MDIAVCMTAVYSSRQATHASVAAKAKLQPLHIKPKLGQRQRGSAVRQCATALACITNPSCLLKRLFSFCPLKVTAPVLRMALHEALPGCSAKHRGCQFVRGSLAQSNIDDVRLRWTTLLAAPANNGSTSKDSMHAFYLCALEPMMLRSVVLPLPDGPIRASTSFGRQQPVMLKRICTPTAADTLHCIFACTEIQSRLPAGLPQKAHPWQHRKEQKSNLSHFVLFCRRFCLLRPVALETGQCKFRYTRQDTPASWGHCWYPGSDVLILKI